MKYGYRIRILSGGKAAGAAHKSGKKQGDGLCEAGCPNCLGPMFPVFDLSLSDSRIRELKIWNQSRFVAYCCPRCFLYMEPYFAEFKNDEVSIYGGFRGGGVVHNICLPYDWRPVVLEEIRAGLAPADYLSRQAEDGVYHQLGGAPFKGVNDSLDCFRCAKPMGFSGIVDNDDLNIPLYEDDHRPVSLIIGDYDCLNIFVCKSCSIIGMRWGR